MKLKLALLALATSTSSLAANIEVNDSGYQSSSFCLTKQLYNGVPKYCGATGTYSYKHIPVAVEKSNNHFEVYSANEGGNLVTYIIKNYNTRVKVHTEESWDDPHTNAVVDIDRNGYVYVQLSSRGLSHKFRSGHLYKSSTPYGTDFVKLKGAPSHGSLNQSYPQLHLDNTSKRLAIFSRYEYAGQKSVRTLWVDNNGSEIKLAEGGHYAVSDTNDDGALYVAYNYHPGYNLDRRSNIHVIKSYTWNPSVWYNIKGEKLTLPLAENDPRTLVYNSEAKGTYIYMKDIVVEESGTGGGVHVLFTESTSYDPTQGTRFTKDLDIQRYDNIKLSTITEVNHNYSAATYITDRFAWTISGVLVNGNNAKPYFGGDINYYSRSNGAWKYDSTVSGDYAYIRKVRGANYKAVASKGSVDIPNDNTQVRIEIK
ncbi:hypothetical protein [Pseudoalteromonas byunsanensis]|uniref:Uncharacterized protein n=1 Tax=Pseudoalteromonas byunsanensis TaxID=327939 RepID=A0A1S1NAP9_9GAMM|nr:hypothetical protein [Pseudoalteromonas byunsanensis]OHU96524.1 hypothetical protein BIW53_04130 [Pseudoalteromonas byunsanensis]